MIYRVSLDISMEDLVKGIQGAKAAQKYLGFTGLDPAELHCGYARQA